MSLLLEMFTYPFILRAFVVGILVALCAALLGVPLVLKRYSMIGDGLSHVSFGALSITLACGWAPLPVSIPVVVLAALGLLRMTERSRMGADAAIAVVSASALAVGVVVTSLTTGMTTDVDSFMFGSILAMDRADVALSVGLCAAVLVLYVLFRSHLTEKRSYDLHRRFAEIFCALGLCMALAVLLAYGKAWAASGHIGGVLYLSYRNFATSVLLTALPMPFYLSLRHRGHLATAAVLALALALTGSRSALLFGGILLTLCCVYLMRSGVISRRCLVLLAAAAGIGILALGPALLECVLHSRVGEDIQDSNSDRLQFLARAADDFLRHPVFGIGLCSTRNADVFTGVEGSMVFYHNSLAQVMGSMGLVGIVAYGRLLHDRIALLRQGSRDPFVRILTLSYLGMFLISLCNPGEFCPFPNAALMVMVFAQAEEAVGDVAVPVRQLLARHLGAPAGFLQF